MENDANLEMFFRVWPNHPGASLEVRLDGDGMVTIATRDKASEDYFGKVAISFEPKVATLLAEALKRLTDAV